MQMPRTPVCRLIFFFNRQQIAYNTSADPEAQEKIQKRAERFKASLNPRRSTTPSVFSTLQTMVRICDIFITLLYECCFLFVLSTMSVFAFAAHVSLEE